MDHGNRGRHRYTPYDGRGGRQHRHQQGRGSDDGLGRGPAPRPSHNGRNASQHNSFNNESNATFDASSIGDWMSDNYYDEPPPRGYDPSDDAWAQDQIHGKMNNAKLSNVLHTALLFLPTTTFFRLFVETHKF